jgi:hypothetical protein
MVPEAPVMVAHDLWKPRVSPPPPGPLPSPRTGPLRYAGSPCRKRERGSQAVRSPLSSQERCQGPWG